MKPSLTFLLVLLLTGCADPARALYEGIRTRNESARAPMERAIDPTPDYDSYQRERGKLEKKHE